ncbi:MAG: 4-(cytidine 5'-diphospho)-2-C-methyl-D-erythritol kinase [Nevskiales bacterium]|nr:4-(cytidine 5'-diphospho)-2-C-methyl-D-erythritol kinase [Nevskiales bacterium]
MSRRARPAAARAWPAPAKLNLFLHVTGRRADGYHLLQTVFQFLDRGDDLFFAVRDDGRVRRLGSTAGIAETEDLTVRAAQALRAFVGDSPGCDIRVHKRIPLGSGLGGGSSDAATTLVALNRLWNLGLSEDTLAGIGLTLGADVPVFVRGFAAWAEGIGERLTPVTLPEPWYLVVTPLCAVSSREIYQAPELPRSTPRIEWRDFQTGSGHNDLLSPVRARYPEVGQALERLAPYGNARLSGSGASVFVDFHDRAAAAAARRQLPPDWRSFVARGRNRSPLQVALEQSGKR